MPHVLGALYLPHQTGLAAILRTRPSTRHSIAVDPLLETGRIPRCIRQRVVVSNRRILRQGLACSRILPCLGLFGKGVSTREVVFESGGVVLFLPSCETSKVSGRGFAGRPD